ncbi:thyrotropin-releasing hormone receptor [Biomphalaria pfeifferi]|uniref:Thyrotropin-releasing hormone receptor n=1 Tax=Biomphalaria pfeifferi TaxID=112525 RepID=A0AAD8B5S6_BIOPF|nr:thyrotropin-releasing hormone receptor [Biomphalaria pfeifferi]
MALTYLNSSNPLSTSVLQELQDVVINIMDMFIFCGLLPLLSVCGLLTNILNILVLSKYGLHETTSLLLFSLSVSDLFYSLVQLFLRLHSFVALIDPLLAMSLKTISVVYIAFIPGYFGAISNLHTTIIAVERLVAVCFPLKMSWVFTPYRMTLLLVIVYFYVVVLLMPSWFLYEPFWTFDPSTNMTIIAIKPTLFFKRDFESITQYLYLGLLNLLSTLPFVNTVVCSIVIGYKMTVRRKTSLTKMSSLSKDVKEKKVIKMMLTVCVVNSCVSLPVMATDLFLVCNNTLIQSVNKMYYLLQKSILVFSQVNATINFIIYISLSSKFASTLEQIYSCGVKKNKK